YSTGNFRANPYSTPFLRITHKLTLSYSSCILPAIFSQTSTPLPRPPFPALPSPHLTDPNADIPSDTSPLDVGQLLLVYLKCLPEPLMTFSLFSGVATVGSSDVTQLRRLLHTLPAVNLETLHAVLCLLYRVSLHADVNKMDAQSLAAEFAPVLLWPRPEVPPSPSPSPSPSPHASSASGPFDSSPSSKPPSSTARSPSLSSLSLDETREGAGAGAAAAAGDGGDGSRGMDSSSISKSTGGVGVGGGSARVSDDVPSLMAPSSPPALTPKGSAASASVGGGAAGGGDGVGGADGMASPAMRRAQSEKGMRVGDGVSAATAAADGPAVVKANGESSVPEIPLEEEPTQAQTAIVEAIMVLIDSHESIFSHNPDGPILLPIPS
ncbi:unnamed protein product, partial [Closterium sp. NIES-54]